MLRVCPNAAGVGLDNGEIVDGREDEENMGKLETCGVHGGND